MRIIVLATLTAVGIGLAGVSGVAAAPVNGAGAIGFAVDTLPQLDNAQYWRYRRHYWRPRYYRPYYRYRYYRRW
jgi:hypothetical protein